MFFFRPQLNQSSASLSLFFLQKQAFLDRKRGEPSPPPPSIQECHLVGVEERGRRGYCPLGGQWFMPDCPNLHKQMFLNSFP